MPEREELTIDELAARSGVASRTIRFYQSAGALPRPRIDGRVAYYGPEHLARLTQIAQLQDRGLTIRAIRDLLGRADQGELGLSEWLGLGERLQQPWSEDRPVTLSRQELGERVGADRPGLVAALARHGVVEARDGAYYVDSPALLTVALQLERAGIAIDVAVRASDILRKYLGRAADKLVAHFLAHAGEGFGQSSRAADIGRAFETLQPLGLEAVRIVFAREMQRALGELIRSGRAQRVPRRRRR